VTVELTPGISDSIEKMELNLAKWMETSWQEVGKVSTSLGPNEVNIPDGIQEEGFFRLSFVLTAQNGELSRFESHAIVCNNWRKDILSFCRELKDEIEMRADAQLIRHCIAVSHFDHTMEIISQASFLSGRVLRALGDAMEGKKALDDGQCPDLVRGLNKVRLKRFEGAAIAEFAVFVPAEYDSSRAWPVFLNTDETRWGTKHGYTPHLSLIDIWWHTISKTDLRWRDYEALMEVLDQKLNIDKDRVYVDGQCHNGIAAMALGLNYPDRWAECSALLGNSYRELAGNAFNLPLIFVKGGHNEDPLIGYYDFAVKCFQYHGCRNFKHSKTQDTVSARGAGVPQAVRERSPQRVLFTIESLDNPRAYWVKVGGREDENLPGTIDVCVWGQTILVKTENIDAYSLDLSQAPIDANRPVEIIENRRSLGFITDQTFTKSAEKYAAAEYIKNENLHGPVWNAFAEPYVVVCGTGGGDEDFCEVSESIGESIRQGGPCYADVNVPAELINTHNFILVGTPESNLWLSRICKQLPVQIERGQITIGDKSYKGRDTGLILIYPNPLNPKKYAVVFSGTSSKAMASIPNSYSQMRSLRPADVGIFELADSGSTRWHIIEKFNTVWNWHDKWDRILTTADKEHPKWQWRQWVAKVIREQLESDVVVCEDPFISTDSGFAGQITYRDLFNNLRNDWIVKIRLDGSNLRKLLMVPFNDISKREVAAPIIDGISLVKSTPDVGEKVLAIDELVDDITYTVALPERCINGQRVGLVLQDYQIVGQAYLVPVLGEYLSKSVNTDIDTQLDSLKYNIL
jgi:hypothetical protein